MQPHTNTAIWFTPSHTTTTPISPISVVFFPLYNTCSIIQTFLLLCLSAPLCVIVCCYAQPPASELWCYGQALSAFGCSEANQLWQSCKLFLWRAKWAAAHIRSVHHTFIRSQSAPMGPLSVRSERPRPCSTNDMDHKKRLFSVHGGQKERDTKREEVKGG